MGKKKIQACSVFSGRRASLQPRVSPAPCQHWHRPRTQNRSVCSSHLYTFGATDVRTETPWPARKSGDAASGLDRPATGGGMSLFCQGVARLPGYSKMLLALIQRRGGSSSCAPRKGRSSRTPKFSSGSMEIAFAPRRTRSRQCPPAGHFMVALAKIAIRTTQQDQD